MTKTRALALIASALFTASCTANLDPGAESVKVVTANQKERCKSLGVVSTEHRLGPNKPNSAMNKAMNEVARRGGNAFYVIATNLDWADGASVNGEALSCTAN